MKKKLHKDYEALLAFLQEQRRDPPDEFTYRAGLVAEPGCFTLADLQAHLNNPILGPDWLDLVVKGKKLSLEQACLFKTVQKKKLYFMDKEMLNEHLADGAAVVLEGLDILDPMINALLSRIDECFPCVLANCVAFFSQSDNEAYPAHCDTDDVLVFQLDGRKTWHLFAPQQRRYFGAANLSDEQLGPVRNEITLRPGDALYIRAGVPHRCVTPGSYSLHLSIDLGDRTPNVEQIAAAADELYKHAPAAAYDPPSQVVDQFAGIMQSPDFLATLQRETDAKSQSIRGFRQRMGRAAAVRHLSKLKK